MTNNEIIFRDRPQHLHPRPARRAGERHLPAEQIAARRANVTITVDEGSDGQRREHLHRHAGR